MAETPDAVPEVEPVEGEAEGERAATAEGKNAVLAKVLAFLPTIGICVGLAAAAAALVLFVIRPLFPPVSANAARPAAPQKFGRVIALESVVVNIAQTEGRRYLKATVSVEVPEEEKIVKEVETRKPLVLDALVATLSKKSLADVTAPEALDRLRAEVLERLTASLGPERVRRVFITEFVVQ
ncbi:MAG TPA: flagellar basal body-associated FliL family protein [Candidatus Baltobacteraceae bacterium]|nr:flagellar basal body-associated FliL family protein [Candidatus Baltobacteraceae bacterium]